MKLKEMDYTRGSPWISVYLGFFPLGMHWDLEPTWISGFPLIHEESSALTSGTQPRQKHGVRGQLPAARRPRAAPGSLGAALDDAPWGRGVRPFPGAQASRRESLTVAQPAGVTGAGGSA